MRIVVLVSGTGSNLQAVIDAVKSGELDVEIAAVGADRPDTYGVERSDEAGIETFVVNFNSFETRAEWDSALRDKVLSYKPDVVVSSGFMRIVSADFIDAFGGQVRQHPPRAAAIVPGRPRSARRHRIRRKSHGLHSPLGRRGVDTGPPIIAQEAVAILPEDSEESLHERIKVVERRLLVQTLADLAAAPTP